MPRLSRILHSKIKGNRCVLKMDEIVNLLKIIALIPYELKYIIAVNQKNKKKKAN